MCKGVSEREPKAKSPYLFLKCSSLQGKLALVLPSELWKHFELWEPCPGGNLNSSSLEVQGRELRSGPCNALDLNILNPHLLPQAKGRK